MKANLQSVRIAPKKANLIARMVRGLSVPDAMEQLRRTNKKGARMIEQLLRSAISNASHNDKQNAQGMVIKTIVVNQGQAYQRGMPMARGRTRPFRKFLSHISITLGFPEDAADAPKKGKTSAVKKTTENDSPKDASQKAKNPVKVRSSRKKAEGSTSDSSVSSSSSPVSA